VVLECLLDALGAGDPDALVDRECLPQVRGAFGGVAVLKVAVAKSFQGACLLEGNAQVADDGQRQGVAVTGLLSG
jgi:hypothetical protein